MRLAPTVSDTLGDDALDRSLRHCCIYKLGGTSTPSVACSSRSPANCHHRKEADPDNQRNQKAQNRIRRGLACFDISLDLDCGRNHGRRNMIRRTIPVASEALTPNKAPHPPLAATYLYTTRVKLCALSACARGPCTEMVPSMRVAQDDMLPQTRSTRKYGGPASSDSWRTSGRITGAARLKRPKTSRGHSSTSCSSPSAPS